MREYSHMTILFTNLLKGKGCKSNQPISWNSDLDKVFNELKLKVKDAPVLPLPNSSRPYVLETDASDYALGAALFQDGNPVAFESKKFDDTRIKWPTLEKDLYAVVYALKKWRHYLYGARFVILTDHQSIKYVCDGIDLRGHKTKWTKLMQDFDLDIRYPKATLNTVADALSRILDMNALSFTEISTDLFHSLRGLCKHDHYFGTYWQMVREGSSIVIDQTSLTVPSLIQVAEGQWEIQNGLLFRNQKICVPDIQDLCLRIMCECHGTPTAGHPGLQRTLALVK